MIQSRFYKQKKRKSFSKQNKTILHSFHKNVYLKKKNQKQDTPYRACLSSQVKKLHNFFSI